MESNESYPADTRRPARSGLDDFSGGPQLQAKLRDKLAELAHWRISPSSIRFPTEGPQFNGGCADVSRALLTVSCDRLDRITRSDGTRSGVKDSNGRTNEPDRRVLKSKDDGDVEGSKTETRRARIEAKEKWGITGRNLIMKLLGRRTSSLSGFVDGWSSRSSNINYKAVAVKKMKISDDPWRILRLTLREAGFLVELSHPNIITLEGLVESVSNNMIWLVFPWEEQGNMRDFIASEDWEIPERISLINDTARGVEYLHTRTPPILHGDLKSMNILINSEYRALITDFGSARRLTTENLDQGREPTESPSQAGLLLEVTFCSSTNTMTLTGDKYTLRWAAPELLNGDTPGLWSDIWALGWVAYEAMTNSIPFQNVNDGMVVASVIQGELPSITTENRMLLIQALCSLMVDCWRIDPRQRPTAKECRKSIRWMPMITPNPRTVDTTASGVRSPRLLAEIGNMHALQGDYLNASEFFTKALDINTDRRGRANALQGLAEVHRLRNEYSRALTLYLEALQICRDIGDIQRKAYVLQGLGDVHRLQNGYNQAIMYYSEVLQICTDIGGRQRRAHALQGLGDVHRVRGEYSQAGSFYSEALRVRTDIGDRRGRAEALWSLGEVHRARNKYTQAMACYTEALQIRDDIGDRQGRANALFGLAEVHRVQHMYDQAIKSYNEGLQIQTKTGDRQGMANTLFGLAEVHRARHEYSDAVRSYDEALRIRTEIGDRRGKAYALSGLADVYRARNEYSLAIAFYSEALQIRTDIGHKRGRAYALWGIAEVHRLQSEYSQAMTFFSEALTVFTDIGDGYCGAFSLLGLGDLHRDQDDHMNAILHYEQAFNTFEKIGNRKGAASALKRAANVRRLLEQNEAAGS